MITPKPFLALAPALACSLVLTACGGSEPEEKPETEPSSSPSTTVDVPEGVTLTEPGTELAFGEKATVAYEPNSKRGSVLDITVTKVRRASINELGSYVLDASTRKSAPYYVSMRVANVGSGNLGSMDVPVFLVDSTDTLIHSSSFTNRFKTCPSTQLPKAFARGAKVNTCQLFLVPQGASYREMSFRPVQQVEPIIWEGKVTNTPTRAKEVKQAQQKAKKLAQQKAKKAKAQKAKQKRAEQKKAGN